MKQKINYVYILIEFRDCLDMQKIMPVLNRENTFRIKALNVKRKLCTFITFNLKFLFNKNRRIVLINFLQYLLLLLLIIIM